VRVAISLAESDEVKLKRSTLREERSDPRESRAAMMLWSASFCEKARAISSFENCSDSIGVFGVRALPRESTLTAGTLRIDV